MKQVPGTCFMLYNPIKFMKPYNPVKVEKANTLFGKLGQGVVSYSDYIKIKSEVDELYND